MNAVVLAAGYGTRLYPLARAIPKALLPIRERPILSYLVDKLTDPALGMERLVLVSNSRYAENFRAWFSQANLPLPWEVLDDGSTSEENRLGSVGDLAFAIRSCQLEGQGLLALGSDNLFQGSLANFCSFAQEKAPAVTLGAYELPDRRQGCLYGVLETDLEGRVLELKEKPKDPPSALVSMAVYFFPRTAVGEVLEYVGQVSAPDTLGSFVHWLIQRNPVFAYRFQGPWFDIGDITSYTQAQESFSP